SIAHHDGYCLFLFFFFFSSRRRHTRFSRDWSSACALPIFGSSEAIACWIIQYASSGLAQLTTFNPAVCTKYVSGDSEWCSTAPIPPPYGMRTTTGRRTLPADR